MTLASPIPALAVPSPRLVARPATWFEVRERDLPLWNDVLRGSHTWLYQFPFWNEPYRALHLTPRYLAWGTQDRPLAFVCILTVGFRPVKIGLVFRGPAVLQTGAEFPAAALAELLQWARAEGYMFIRFTHSDPEVMGQLAALDHSRNFDAFPYFLDYPVMSHDFVVEQCDSDEATLAGLDREVRRKLRRATEAGYEFRSDDSPQALADLWPLYQECARRKHFRLERPLSVYMQTMKLAQPHDCARIYSVHLNGKAVGSTLVVRDGTTAHCILAAFDAAHRQSAVFLHWETMRDMYRMGAHHYNLGPGPGSLARFKAQFARYRVAYPAPVTVVLKENWFRLWWKLVFPVARRLRPVLRKLVCEVNK